MSRKDHRKKQPIQPLLEVLKKALEYLQQLKQQGKKGTYNKILQLVHVNFTSLDRKTFYELSEAIMIYADEILIASKGKRNERTDRFDSILRSLKLMPENSSLLKLWGEWNEQLTKRLKANQPFQPDKVNGITRSYFSHHLNKCVLSDNFLFFMQLIILIVPDDLFLLNDMNLERIDYAVMLVDYCGEVLLKKMISWHLQQKNIKNLIMLMMNACEVGYVQGIQCLLEKKINFPENFELLYRPVDNAIEKEDIAFLNLIYIQFFRFDKRKQVELLKKAIDQHFYFFSMFIIFIDRGSIARLEVSKLLHLIELAAVRSDIQGLHLIFNALNNSEKLKEIFVKYFRPTRKEIEIYQKKKSSQEVVPQEQFSIEASLIGLLKEKLFNNHVAPYLMTDSSTTLSGFNVSSESQEECLSALSEEQAKYSSGFDKGLNIVRYFMSKGSFTFSLDEEKKEPTLLGPRALGRLCQTIQYSQKAPNAHRYGMIRRWSLRIKILSHAKESWPRIKKQFYTPDGQFQEKIKAVYSCNGRDYCLTQYSYRAFNGKGGMFLEFVLPSIFRRLSDEVQRIYKNLPKPIMLFDNPFEDLTTRINVLKDIARIIWLFSHLYLYCNQDTQIMTVVNFVHGAMLLEFGLKPMLLLKDEDVEFNWVTAGMAALTFCELNDWVKFYPQLFGKRKYEHCIDLLGGYAEYKNDPDLVGRFRYHLFDFNTDQKNKHNVTTVSNIPTKLAQSLLKKCPV